MSTYAATMDRQQADQVRQLQEAVKLRRDIVFVSDFKAVLVTVEGRRFVRRVLAECGVHQSSFCDQPLPMAFKEGRRAIGLWLQSLFVDCPDQYIQLLMEQAKDDDGW